MRLFLNYNIARSSSRVHPCKLVIYGVSFWGIMWIIAPVKAAETLTVDSVMYIVSCIVMWYLGCMFPFEKKRFLKKIYYKSQLQRIYLFMLLLSFLAVSLRFYDLFYVRDNSIGLDSFGDNIDALENKNGSSMLAIVVALLYYVPFIPVSINLLFPKLNGLISKVLALLLFCCLGVGALITGSRNAFLDPLLLYSFLFLFTRKHIVVKVKYIVCGLILTGAFLMISSVLFVQRLSVQNKTVFDAAESVTGGASDKVPPKDYYKDFMSANVNNPIVLGGSFAYLQTTQYAIHGFWEFPICKKYIDKNDFKTYGASTFWVFDKFLYKFGIGINPEDVMKYNARPGIWSTFFYNWYLDFGWGGLFVIFLLGILMKYIWCKVCYGNNVFYLPLLMFFVLLTMYMMQLNRFVGTGSYALVCFSIFALWGSHIMPSHSSINNIDDNLRNKLLHILYARILLYRFNRIRNNVE